MELIKKTSHLLLLEAIEYGQKNNVFDGSFLQEVREEGAAMTVRFATEYYNPNYEAYLRHSADVILGVCNLGAILWSKNNVKDTAFLLKEHGLVKLFRKGFTAVKKVAEGLRVSPDNSKHMTDKECAEVFMTGDNVNWSGYEQYLSLNVIAGESVTQKSFVDWFWEKYNVTQDRITDDISEAPIETAALSMILYDDPRAALSLKDVCDIAEALVNNTEDALRHIESFCLAVPDKFVLQAQSVSAGLINTLQDLMLTDEETEDRALNIAIHLSHSSRGVVLSSDLDEIARFRADAYDDAKKADLIEEMQILNQEEMIPYMKKLLSLNPTPQMIVDVMELTSDWHGYIQWSQFSYDDIDYIVKSADEPDIVLDDVYEYGFSKADPGLFFGQMPIYLLRPMIRHDVHRIWFVRDMCKVQVSDLEGGSSKDNGHLSFLLKPEQYYSYCYGNSEHVRSMVTVAVNVLKYNDQAEEEIVDYICNFVRNIVEGFRNEADTIENDNLFFDKDFHRAVKVSLGNSLCKKVVEKLKEN